MLFNVTPTPADGSDRSRNASASIGERPYPFGQRLARYEWQMLLDRWQRLQPNADRFATAFFDTLFACQPELVRLFGGASLEAQFLRFAHLLTEIVSAEDDHDELDRRVEQIVQRYARDDSATEESRAVRAAIAALLDEVARAGMTWEMRLAWRATYAAVNSMLRGTTWQGARNATILHTALQAEIAADRRSPTIERLTEPIANAEAA